ncbi:hypothetical protein Q1695_010264 [Nippostrongylus brasiliensis]|nr:hypothetical protein Q1695_010264 [Nippostrongylus brasiliensis]
MRCLVLVSLILHVIGYQAARSLDNCGSTGSFFVGFHDGPTPVQRHPERVGGASALWAWPRLRPKQRRRIDPEALDGSYAAPMTATVFERLLLPFAVVVLLVGRVVPAVDVFCGQLTIYEQQRFGLNSVALSQQETTDLKQCLELCCSVLNCRGVTFTGVIVPHAGEPNCLLVGCRDDCALNERAEYTDGLVSVLINRTQPSPSNQSQSSSQVEGASSSSTVTGSATTTTTGSASGDDLSAVVTATIPITSTTSTNSSSNAGISAASLAPVWAVALAIGIAVLCVGLNLGLLSAYICYRRKRSRKRTAHFTANKGPTLHAYNTTLGLR